MHTQSVMLSCEMVTKQEGLKDGIVNWFVKKEIEKKHLENVNVKHSE